MSESPAEPEARPTEDPEIVPSSQPDGLPPITPGEPSATNPDADGIDETDAGADG